MLDRLSRGSDIANKVSHLGAAKRLGVLIMLLVAALLAAPALIANIGRVRALQAVDVRASPQERARDGWQSGWERLCDGESLADGAQDPTTQRVLSFVAMSAIDQGNYDAALRWFRQLEAAGGDENVAATAYRAALELNWQKAVEQYKPNAFNRHRQFWGAVFYQAAQQLFFTGKVKQAAAWYRRADALYDTNGPLNSLALVNCLEQQGRFAEAWDVYRRALAALPAEEALTHRERFNRLRLAGLRQWRQQDPENGRVAHWLEFYEADERAEESVTLTEAPKSMAPFDFDLGEGRKLVGLDYWAEDMETGPFMVVDIFIQSGESDAPSYERARRTVLNQAPNGSFAWDATPDGVRPAGWPRWVYGPDAGVLRSTGLHPDERWLCLEDLPGKGGYGAESWAAPTVKDRYVQGGRIWNDDRASAALGRYWFKDESGYPYSYAGYAHPPAGERRVAGIWEAPTVAEDVAVWLLAQNGGVVCYTDLFLFGLPVQGKGVL